VENRASRRCSRAAVCRGRANETALVQQRCNLFLIVQHVVSERDRGVEEPGSSWGSSVSANLIDSILVWVRSGGEAGLNDSMAAARTRLRFCRLSHRSRPAC
jgi:hypothetical protein